MTNGERVNGETLWRWQSTGHIGGHLQNKRTYGHLNFRPGGYVRGHGNEQRPPRQPAAASESTALTRQVADFSHQASEYPCGATGAPVFSFRFRTRGGGYLAVLQDGALDATRASCADEPACLFAMEPAAGHVRFHMNGIIERALRLLEYLLVARRRSLVGRAQDGWHVVRSVLSGKLLRMVGDHHPPFDGFNGMRAPKARLKHAGRRKREAQRAQTASAQAVCPLRDGAPSAPPVGWRYNASKYESGVARALAPWYDCGVSATVVDLAFAAEMYPYQNFYERPSVRWM